MAESYTSFLMIFVFLICRVGTFSLAARVWRSCSHHLCFPGTTPGRPWTHTHTQAVCADVRVSMTSVDIICLSLSSCGFTLTWTWTATCFILIFNYIPHGDLPFLPQRGRIPTPKWVLQACTLTCETFLTTSALTNSPWTNDLAVTNARITFAFMSRGTSPNGRSVSCCLATHSR